MPNATSSTWKQHTISMNNMSGDLTQFYIFALQLMSAYETHKWFSSHTNTHTDRVNETPSEAREIKQIRKKNEIKMKNNK